MQKTYLFIGIMILWSVSISQPIIEKNHLPVPGYSAYISTPDTLLQVDPTPTDTNYHWDFSAFTAISQRKDSFIALSAVPFAIRFQVPGEVNVVQTQNTPDSVGGVELGEAYTFFEANDTAYLGYGIGGTVSALPLALINFPPDVIYSLPLTYDQRDTSYSEAELAVPGLLYVKREQLRITHVDGWGTLSTPYGMFSVLRVNSSTTGSDTLSFDTLGVRVNNPLQTEYKWIGVEERIPLLQINTVTVDSVGEFVNSIAYADSMRNFDTTSTGIEKTNLTKPLSIYPNPAQNQTTIELPDFGGYSIEIYDLNGKLVQKTAFRGGKIDLNLFAFKKGVYPVKVVGERQVYTGKLVIR